MQKGGNITMKTAAAHIIFCGAEKWGVKRRSGEQYTEKTKKKTQICGSNLTFILVRKQFRQLPLI